MKYEFIKVDNDIYKLKYGEKEFNVLRDVDIVTQFQNVNNIARRKMIVALAKDGLTTGDLTIVRKVGNKTIYDNRNAIDMEKTFVYEEYNNVIDYASKKYFQKSIVDIMLDIGLETEEEGVKFSKEFMEIIVGKKASEDLPEAPTGSVIEEEKK